MRTKRTARDRLRAEEAATAGITAYYAPALKDIDVNAKQAAPEAAPPKGVAPTWGPAQVTFRKPADLDQFLQNNATLGLQTVEFDRDFGIRDEHILRLVKTVGGQLTTLRLGNSDTGDGTWLTDNALHAIARRCPNLEVLQLASCVGITGAALTAVVQQEQLARLRELHLTGHDRTHGKLNDKALKALADDPSAMPNLHRLYITDQSVSDRCLQRLKRLRPGLAIQAGQTDDDDSYAGYCVARAMGGWGHGLSYY